jgi:hypothetical protein
MMDATTVRDKLMVLNSKIILTQIVGTYECKVDAKAGYYSTPLKKQMTLSLQDGFVLKRSVFSLVWNYIQWINGI